MPRNQWVFLPGLPAKGEQELDHSDLFISIIPVDMEIAA